MSQSFENQQTIQGIHNAHLSSHDIAHASDDHTHVSDNHTHDSHEQKYQRSNVDIALGQQTEKPHTTRLISRSSGASPNVTVCGRVQSHLYLYHVIIDISWPRLFVFGFAIFFLFNLFFSTIFFAIDGVQWNGDDTKEVTWGNVFHFTLETMSTIGYGALIPSTYAANWLVFFLTYLSGIFWTAVTGIMFAKISRPTRLKRQIKFSNVAVINKEIESFIPHFFDDPEDEEKTAELKGMRWTEYGDYGIDEDFECLQFRFGDTRIRSGCCEPMFSLLCFQRTTICDENKEEWEDYIIEEMDYDLNRQKGRVRGIMTSIPLLSLPWVVTHKINKLSPLYGLSKQDMIDRKIEIIAVMDGIDAATSDNFQSWFSYTGHEMLYNYKFMPMVKAAVAQNNQRLYVDYDRISLIKKLEYKQEEEKSSASQKS